MVELFADLPADLDALVRFVTVEDVAASARSDPSRERLARSGEFGPMGIGLFANNAGLQADVLAADLVAGEKLWPLPLWPEYKSLLRSEVADLRNISVTVQQGSMMTAAAFLHEFAGKTPWAHLDIYNSSRDSGHHPYLAPGPTGSGTMTLIAFLMRRSER